MQLLEHLLPSVPLQVLAILAISIVVAKVADWIVSGVLRTWARGTSTDVDDQLVRLVHGPVVKTVVLGGLLLAYWQIDQDQVRDVLLQRVAGTVILGLWTLFAFRATSLLLRSASTTPGISMIEGRTFPVFDNVAKTLITALAAWGLIAIWNINALPWLASAGVVGIAIGFAAQDTLSNFIAGIFIIADAPYRVGDYVNLDNGQRGMVSRIGLRSTRILTRDDIEITIPNAIIGNAPIINESAGPNEAHRIRIKVSVAYGTELEAMREILLELGLAHPDVCDDPEPRVRFRDFGDSGLNHELLCWIPRPELRGKVFDELNTSIHDSFAAANIEIPFPKRDLYVKQLPPLPTR